MSKIINNISESGLNIGDVREFIGRFSICTGVIVYIDTDFISVVDNMGRLNNIKPPFECFSPKLSPDIRSVYNEIGEKYKKKEALRAEINEIDKSLSMDFMKLKDMYKIISDEQFFNIVIENLPKKLKNYLFKNGYGFYFNKTPDFVFSICKEVEIPTDIAQNFCDYRKIGSIMSISKNSFYNEVLSKYKKRNISVKTLAKTKSCSMQNCHGMIVTSSKEKKEYYLELEQPVYKHEIIFFNIDCQNEENARKMAKYICNCFDIVEDKQMFHWNETIRMMQDEGLI